MPKGWGKAQPDPHRKYLLPINSNIGQDGKDTPVVGVEKTTLCLQFHLWTVSLLMQDCLRQSHQVQQITHPRIVWINLLHVDAVYKNLKPTSVEVPEFQFAGRYQSIQHLGCMDWSVYLSSCYILSVHHFLEKYSVNTLYVYHHMSAKHYSVLTFRGILSM